MRRSGPYGFWYEAWRELFVGIRALRLESFDVADRLRPWGAAGRAWHARDFGTDHAALLDAMSATVPGEHT
ncbi:hypothetical protein ABZ636_33160 [Streptomyces sp. NPDC007251]|uniref:hypothetical protein n=1 Tax=Streptomyces sp. NPDC007251 TaxID=3154483 RepID=UPI00340E8F42